jgi:four helix bundle protein
MESGFKSLKVYQMAYELAMKIFTITKGFPKEEVYSLTDQMRRSSRSVCTNIAEAYRKRIYPKHFSSKITDADGEASETLVWLDSRLILAT